MNIYLIPFLLVTALLVLFIYAWLQCREEQQPDRVKPTRLEINVEADWGWGLCLYITVNSRRLVIQVGQPGGVILHIDHLRRCPGCSTWFGAGSFVVSVWGREECPFCAEHAAYDFFQVNEHYGRADDLPAPGAWIPEALVTVYDEHARQVDFRNVVW